MAPEDRAYGAFFKEFNFHNRLGILPTLVVLKESALNLSHLLRAISCCAVSTFPINVTDYLTSSTQQAPFWCTLGSLQKKNQKTKPSSNQIEKVILHVKLSRRNSSTSTYKSYLHTPNPTPTPRKWSDSKIRKTIHLWNFTCKWTDTNKWGVIWKLRLWHFRSYHCYCSIIKT